MYILHYTVVIILVFCSFGILLWEIWCRRLQFGGYSFNYEAADAIGRGERPPVPSDCPFVYAHLMRQKNDQRPDFAFVVERLEKLLKTSVL